MRFVGAAQAEATRVEARTKLSGFDEAVASLRMSP
jgi:hypothetical protein